MCASAPAHALQAIPVEAGKDRIDITALGDHYEGRGDRLQIETAAGADGVSGRMEVKALAAGTNPNWVVFAIHNPTDRAVERWLTAERYQLIGSGFVLPDLDQPRLSSVTPSVGYVPERVPNDRTDIFKISIGPGQTITYVAEISSERFPLLTMWEPIALEKKLRDRSLFNGILIGITALLAIFLTAIFAANHKAIFPTAALIAWSVLAYLCVDFGFWQKIFQLDAGDNAFYRAAAEAAIAASLAMFLYTFLRLGRWDSIFKFLLLLWLAGQLAIVGGSVLDPKLASTLARGSFLFIAGLGTLSIFYQSLRGDDRALSLVPSWLLFLVWLFAAALAVSGRLNGDIVASSLVSGLVLILLLIGFTVTQFAFRSFEPLYGGSQNDMQSRSMAIDAAGAAIFEWHSRRDEIKTGQPIEELLGLKPGQLSARVEDWTKHLHSSDREKFRLALWSLQQKNSGALQMDLRLRHADGSYRWFELRGQTLPQTDQRSLRCLGLLRDITHVRRAHERLVQDAVHDALTGLPNRELFLDRLGSAMLRAQQEQTAKPTVIVIDIDRFKGVNEQMGVIVGDSLLLTLARRLSRHLGAQDTLARVGGDQFAVMILSEQDPREIAGLAERIRRSLRSPIKIAGKDVVLTGSIGIAELSGGQASAAAMMTEAETAMYRAKRGGSDRMELFRPEMREEADAHRLSPEDLKRAIDRKAIVLHYEPIVRLANDELIGFEALFGLEVPKIGTLSAADLIAVAEGGGLLTELVSHLLDRVMRETARWQKELPRTGEPLFALMNLTSRQLFRQDIVQEIRLVLGRETAAKGSLRLAIDERLVLENPERATEVLDWLTGAGAILVLDNFGAGYSSINHLSRLKFEYFRIFSGHIAQAHVDAEGAGVVKSMVGLAQSLGKRAMASGVDQGEDASFLRSIGCEAGQGYFYDEPRNDRDVTDLLRTIRKTERRGEPLGWGLAKKLFGQGDTAADTPAKAAKAAIPPVEPPRRDGKTARPKPQGEGQRPNGNGAPRPQNGVALKPLSGGSPPNGARPNGANGEGNAAAHAGRRLPPVRRLPLPNGGAPEPVARAAVAETEQVPEVKSGGALWPDRSEFVADAAPANWLITERAPQAFAPVASVLADAMPVEMVASGMEPVDSGVLIETLSQPMVPPLAAAAANSPPENSSLAEAAADQPFVPAVTPLAAAEPPNQTEPPAAGSREALTALIASAMSSASFAEPPLEAADPEIAERAPPVEPPAGLATFRRRSPDADAPLEIMPESSPAETPPAEPAPLSLFRRIAQVHGTARPLPSAHSQDEKSRAELDASLAASKPEGGTSAG